VRVSVQGRTRQARAGRSGRFSVQFADVNPCNGGTIVARGSVGSRAVLAIGRISNVHCL
jgi:fructose-1,6-bisphosphatase/sedoheptulose 1,7-bisphosphatase-like protein